MNIVEIKREDMKTSLFPNLSARYLEKEIPIIIKVIPPALNKPKPADIGSSPEKKFSKNYQCGALSFEIISNDKKLICNSGYFQKNKHK